MRAEIKKRVKERRKTTRVVMENRRLVRTKKQGARAVEPVKLRSSR